MKGGDGSVENVMGFSAPGMKLLLDEGGDGSVPTPLHSNKVLLTIYFHQTLPPNRNIK